MNVNYSVKSRCDAPLMFLCCAWKSETLRENYTDQFHSLLNEIREKEFTMSVIALLS